MIIIPKKRRKLKVKCTAVSVLSLNLVGNIGYTVYTRDCVRETRKKLSHIPRK